MATYVSGKMKRKDFDEVYEDFIDLPFYSPATKIRRLDTDLPPIMDKQELYTNFVMGKLLPDEEMCSTAVLDGRPELIEAILPSTVNEERALVMYRPPDAHISPSLKLDPELITGLKYYTLWPRNPNMFVNKECNENMQLPTNECLAVVPWVPSYVPLSSQAQLKEASTSGITPMEDHSFMEAEEDNHSFMEIEEDMLESNDSGALIGAPDNQQWQQHNYMPPPFFPGNSAMTRS